MANHALLSASSASRWLNCTPAARLGENKTTMTSLVNMLLKVLRPML